MLRRLPFVLLPLVVSCSDAPTLPDLDVAVVDAVGGSPLEGRAITSIRALHREALGDFLETTSAVEDGTFELVLPVTDFAAVSELRVELRSAGGVELVGSTPSFYPGEGSSVRIVVGAPGTCDVVTASQLPIERKGFGTAALGTFALLIGGIEPSGSSERIGWHDLLLHGPGSVTFDLPETPGRSRAAAVSRTRALVISEGASPFLYDLYAQSSPREAVTLHTGARNATTVLAMGDTRAIVIGGTHEGASVAGVSIVDEQARVAQGSLSAARTDRVATYAGGAVYVVSRDGGAATLERIVASEDPTAAPAITTLVPSFDDGVRLGGALFFDAAGNEGLLVGGEDGVGAPRTDTVRFSGCPNACVLSPGPTWTSARLSPMTHPDGFLVGGEGPSALVDRVVFGSGGPTIVALGPLENARYDGGLLVHPSGALIVFGGEGTSGIRRDVEMCFPPSID